MHKQLGEIVNGGNCLLLLEGWNTRTLKRILLTAGAATLLQRRELKKPDRAQRTSLPESPGKELRPEPRSTLCLAAARSGLTCCH